jgi:hypothetical protein
MAGAFFLIAACKNDPFVAKQGDADFSEYIAVGDSQTAGFANDGLYREGQQAAYPAVMARQMQALGGRAFNQPLFSESEKNGSGYLQLNGFTTAGAPVITRVTTNLGVRAKITIPPYGNVTLYTKYQGANNNFGITGIKVADVTNPQFGNKNGYFERLLPAAAPNNTTAYIDFITSKPYTFFSCWLGNNDALGYAQAGGASDSLTDKNVFNSLYNLAITRLTAKKQKGIVATIPDVTAIPYFTTITVDSIVRNIKKINPSVQGLYINARNSSEISATGYSSRLATNNDLLLLILDAGLIGKPVAAAGNLPYGLTAATPVDNKYVLDQNEVALVKNYISAYNAIIKSVAASKGLAVCDAYAFLNTMKQQGIVQNGIKFTSKFISGGAFSLDGIHLTPRGHVLLANEFNKAINKQYGAALLPAKF